MKLKVVRAEFLTSANLPSQYPPIEDPEIAFAGRSNVGKSSLINVLTNRKSLAITSNTPGRTRLVNFFDIVLDPGPGPIRLVDLPGYGYAKAPKSEQAAWRERVGSYLEGRPSLRGVVHLMDIRIDASPLDVQLSEWLRSIGHDEILVLTKADKLSRNQRLTQATRIEKELGIEKGSTVLFSSLTGEGRDDLWSKIVRSL